MSEPRPTIGVPTALEQARFGAWDVPCALTPHVYVQALQRAGAMVLLIPPDDELAAAPDDVLARLDGLMLAGGGDIDPAQYGAPPDRQLSGVTPPRDRLELALTRRAVELDLPVLGICRGMQLINVALGGTLHQHLPDVVGHSEHRRHLGSFTGSEHQVELEPGSLAERVAGERLHTGCSHHHQGIQRIGEGLVASGRSTLDGLVEALEAPDRDWVLGVQWHPEADPDSPVVGAFVAHVRAAALGRRGAPVARLRAAAAAQDGSSSQWRPSANSRALQRSSRGSG
jgi:putative glutamine amidotransferase